MPSLRLVALLAALALSVACSATAPGAVDAGRAGEGEGEPQGDEEAPPLDDCEDHSDCAGGEACRDGKCRAVCEANEDCAGFYARCDPELGYCVECVSDPHCDDDERCADGLCVFHCSADGQCDEGEACDEETGACFERECSGNADCQGGYVCEDARCVSIDPVICEADSLTCDGDEVVACNGDGTRETRTACAEDEACVENGDLAACAVVLCAPFEIGCTEGGAAYVCDESGTAQTELPCNEGQYCEAGVCRNQRCEPSSATCEGSALVVCDAQGTSSETVRCDLTPACEDEPHGCACVEAECVPRVCQPGTSECVATGYRRCSADGTGYETPVACEGGDVCAGGACVRSSCDPGETQCANDVLLTCNGDGDGWTETSCAASEQACVVDGDSASCGERVCEPLSAVCSDDGRGVVTCNGLGSESTTTPCAADEYCESGVCHAQVCEPGTRSCAGPASTQTCSADGSELTVTSCPAQQECVEGACVATSCTPDCGGRECGPDPVCGQSCGSCEGVCDESGQCQSSSESGLEVVLTWDIDGADIDLLLSRDEEDGLCSDDTCGYDNCHSGSPSRPDWDGNGAESAGDPLLEVDDIDGYGPEVIRLDTPVNGTYFARVHAYRLDVGDTTTATVVVRAGGASVGTFTQLLTGDNDLWDGITITWSGGGATASDDDQVIPDASCSGGGDDGDAGPPGDGGSLVSCEHSGQCAEDEYCAWEVFLSGSCAAGCANDDDCSGSDVCNGAGDCIPASSDLAGRGQACQSDADCEWGYSCGYFFQTCEERCAAAGVAGNQRSCAGDPDCCPKTNASTCVDDAFFGFSATCKD